MLIVADPVPPFGKLIEFGTALIENVAVESRQPHPFGELEH